MNSIIPHQFNNQPVCQLSIDSLIGGILIPKGYVNLTQMCKAGKKKFGHYQENKRSKLYLNELSESIGIPIDQLLIVNESSGNNDERGTWGHHLVGLSVAAWISPVFEVQANKVLWAVINGDYHALTEEAAIAQAKLQEQWQKIRDASKEAFRSLGDATKSYLDAHPEKSDNYCRFIYSNCQNAVNRGLFGKDASTIREELGVADLLRDHYGEAALRRLDLVQSLAAASIVHRDIEPLEAVKQALAMYNFEATDYRS